ncbi:zf-CCHC domain-containing protein [Tanacetum coccineum]
MVVRDFKKIFRRRGKFIRQAHDNKKEFQRAKEEKKRKVDRKCFKCGDPNHYISDCPKHSYNDQKAFVGGCWSDSDEDDDHKKDEILYHGTHRQRIDITAEKPKKRAAQMRSIGIGLKLYECAGDLLILELVLDNHYETAVRSSSRDIGSRSPRKERRT